MGRHWNEKLFGCFDDCGSCLIACLVPCGIPFLHISAVSKATGEGCCSPYCMIFCLGMIGYAINRGKIRMKLDIEGSCISDCCTWVYCPLCAATQEYREVHRSKHHG